MKKGLFPGSFDPPSNGHLDIIERASLVSDKLYVAIAINTKKKSLFTIEEREKMMKGLTRENKKVEVVTFTGLITDFAKKVSADFLLRGIRPYSDSEYEFRMALANRKLTGIETLFLMADESLSHIHSSLIREIAYFNGSLKGFVPSSLEKRIKDRVLYHDRE